VQPLLATMPGAAVLPPARARPQDPALLHPATLHTNSPSVFRARFNLGSSTLPDSQGFAPFGVVTGGRKATAKLDRVLKTRVGGR
jgi:hypothetical protein